MAGNILGRRSFYQYEADDGTLYSIQLDDTLAQATGMVLSAINAAPPRRFEPRGIFVETLVEGRAKRKFLVVGTTSQVNYAANVSTTLDVGGIQFATTGRKGEQITFPRNSDPTDPDDEDGTDDGTP